MLSLQSAYGSRSMQMSQEMILLEWPRGFGARIYPFLLCYMNQQVTDVPGALPRSDVHAPQCQEQHSSPFFLWPLCLSTCLFAGGLSLDVMDLELEPQMVVSPFAVLRTRALPVPQNKCILFGIYILHNLLKYLFFEKQKQNKSKNAVSCSERPPFPNPSLKGLTWNWHVCSIYLKMIMGQNFLPAFKLQVSSFN